MTTCQRPFLLLYAGWGNLVLESSNGIPTEYVLDERGALPTILGEVISDGTTRLYAYGPEGFAAQMTVGGAVEYPLLDGLGSVRHLTDGSGTVTLSRSYDAFGNLRYSTGTGATHLGYTGELQDQPTGLVYLRARFYHPVLGRFLQRDSFAGSIAHGQSLNRYSYTENNPVNLTDPSGNCPWCAVGFGAAAGAAFEYGGQVFQNYRDGQSGSDMFRPRDWGKIGQAAVAGGVAGLTGFYLGPAAAGLMRFGSPLLNSMATGALEGAGSGALSQIATNLMRGCAWNADLLGSLLSGGLGGGIGGALGHAWQQAAKKIQLFGFRGAGRAYKERFVSTQPLMWAGHIGISFNQGDNIYGFTPYAPHLNMEEVVNELLRWKTFPGRVGDDTATFALARELAENEGLRTQVYVWEQTYPRWQFEQIRRRVMEELGSGPNNAKHYGFPQPDQICYNCATWPATVGIHIPEETGELQSYMPLLEKVGSIWK